LVIVTAQYHITVLVVLLEHSLVGIATRYGLGSSEIVYQWRRDFPNLSRPALGPAQPPIQSVPGLSGVGGKAAGAWRCPLTPSSAEVKERVDYTSILPLGLRGLL
jgi:transposase-like protein